jgi:hypothetical protein
MFTSDHPTGMMIDSLCAVEGSFKIDPQSGIPTVSVKMLYTNSKIRDMYGLCTTTNEVYSPKTIQALKDFIKSAEDDMGALVFNGALNSQPDTAATGAGSGEGLPTGIPKGLGGM